MLLEVLDELGHRLLGHAGALGQHADGRAGVVEKLEDGGVRRSHRIVTLFSQPRDHDVVQAQVGLPQEKGDVAAAVLIVCGRGVV
jgi:hypothetical protein